jgi:purine-cytosine permease-like protein
MVEENIDMFDAFKKSWDLTKGEVWHLTWIWLLSILTILVGFMLLIVGALPAAILVMFANLYVYKKLSAH